MEITTDLVRRFFLQGQQWAVPVGLILFILCALIAVTDPPALGPFVYRSY